MYRTARTHRVADGEPNRALEQSVGPERRHGLTTSEGRIEAESDELDASDMILQLESTIPAGIPCKGVLEDTLSSARTHT